MIRSVITAVYMYTVLVVTGTVQRTLRRLKRSHVVLTSTVSLTPNI